MTDLPIFGPRDLAPGETLEPENVNGRFRIKQPDGSKPKLYTRCTTFIGALEDETLLKKWSQRVIMAGLVAEPALYDELHNTDTMDKEAMNKLADRAFEAGEGHVESQKGTWLHNLSYWWDTLKAMPPEMTHSDMADLATILRVCDQAGIHHLYRERRIVIDSMKITGTPDYISEYTCLDGTRRIVIGDLKTGKGEELTYGRGKMAQQLAVYAHAEWLYTDDGSATGLREPMPEVSKTHGLILHVPQGGAVQGLKPHLYEIPLYIGWNGVEISRRVRDWRNYSKRVFHEVPLP